MRVTTDSQFSALVHPDLDHCRFCVDNLLHCLDDLEHIFAVDLLPILKALDHIIDKLLCHLISQSDTIVLIIHGDGVDVQTLESRRLIANFNRFLEFHATDQLLAFGQL